ncbi:MAG: peptidase S46 [Bacteroidetes bacterium RIFOXYA2_FULL_33_7]|nr:MAG: peptidase S46 [Bacteroidetes bacterium RIFOXYA2_FULL_33_7]
MKKIISYLLVVILIIISSLKLRADEGMWLPILLETLKIKDMQAKGCKLSAEDIYSVNNASLKDAVVIFGGGCTGELVSEKGLLITNHHCGYGTIQKHSSVEKDYLTNGFWAMSQEEELSNPGLSVKFLVRMEEVTDAVLKDVSETMTEVMRHEKISANIDTLIKQATKGNQYLAVVESMFLGNNYYLFIYEEYKDVRLVGAPPSAIGKFGGDTDNWMWPRHTGDFSIFRVYADKDNKPAEYSADNVPYKPKKFFPISMKGVKEGDFTMVFGYPGSTTEYLTSYAVKMISENENPHQIKLREKRLEIMKADMDASDKVRIQYSSKYAGIANYWKKWIGENRGLKKLDAIEKKEALEEDFTKWANSSPELKAKYANILPEYKKLYSQLSPYNLALTYFFESALAIEIIQFSNKFNRLKTHNSETLKNNKESMLNTSKSFFKDYNMPTDKKVFISLLKMYKENVPTEFLPKIYKLIETKYNNDYQAYADFVYSKSVLSNEEKSNAFINNFTTKSIKKLENDPAYQLSNSFIEMYMEKVKPYFETINNQIDSLHRHYMKGLMEMQSDKIFYPDANFTMRVTYGKVDDYYPRDGVHYKFYTNLDGIMEKDNPEIYDYDVPDKLKELYINKDYGQYEVDGSVPVCFTASNHTTGGNSGSPVIDADGNLIGVNFDRNWEGTMSDIMYDPNQCRNITLDIRYLH